MIFDRLNDSEGKFSTFETRATVKIVYLHQPCQCSLILNENIYTWHDKTGIHAILTWHLNLSFDNILLILALQVWNDSYLTSIKKVHGQQILANNACTRMLIYKTPLKEKNLTELRKNKI